MPSDSDRERMNGLDICGITWMHPDPMDDGKAAMARIGVGIGDVFLLAKLWEWRNDQPYRCSGDGKWKLGTLIVHKCSAFRLIGWHTPEHGDCDKGMVRSTPYSTSVVLLGVRTGRIIGDQVLCVPIAKAPE